MYIVAPKRPAFDSDPQVKQLYQLEATTSLKQGDFMGAHTYRDVVKEPFLLVDSEENGFGGYFMLVVFKAHRKVYRLWVYKLSSGEFQLREMTPYISLNKALMDELSHADYFPYWLNGCTAEKASKSPRKLGYCHGNSMESVSAELREIVRFREKNCWALNLG